MTRVQLQQQMGDSLLVGEQLTALPVWPVFHRNDTAEGRNGSTPMYLRPSTWSPWRAMAANLSTSWW